MSVNCMRCVKERRTGPDLLCDACRDRVGVSVTVELDDSGRGFTVVRPDHHVQRPPELMTDKALNGERWALRNRWPVTLACRERLDAITTEIDRRNAAYRPDPQTLPDDPATPG